MCTAVTTAFSCIGMQWDSLRPAPASSWFNRQRQEKDDGFSLQSDAPTVADSAPGSCSLHTLQLIAICLGGVRLSKLCSVFLSNYKYFQSGLPDLLLCRIRWRDSADAVEAVATSSCTKVLDIPNWLTSQAPVRNGPSTDSAAAATDAPEVPTAEAHADAAANAEDAQLLDPELLEEPSLSEYPAEDIHLGVLGGEEADAVCECILLEVKSPLDVLSNKQLVWLELLNSINIPSYVCRVFES